MFNREVHCRVKNTLLLHYLKFTRGRYNCAGRRARKIRILISPRLIVLHHLQIAR